MGENDKISKAIFVNMSDPEGAELWKELNILRVTMDISWKAMILSALAGWAQGSEFNPDLTDRLIAYISEKE